MGLDVGGLLYGRPTCLCRRFCGACRAVDVPAVPSAFMGLCPLSVPVLLEAGSPFLALLWDPGGAWEPRGTSIL